jgi:hypothetical protein
LQLFAGPRYLFGVGLVLGLIVTLGLPKGAGSAVGAHGKSFHTFSFIVVLNLLAISYVFG